MSHELTSQLYAFRKEGNLQDAQVMYGDASDEEKSDAYVKKAWLWVLYSGIKQAFEKGNSAEIVKWWNLANLEDSLPFQDEVMIQQFSYLITKTLFSVQKDAALPYSAFTSFFAAHSTKNINEVRFRMLAILKHSDQMSGYDSLLWNCCMENLPENGFQKEEYQGKWIPSVWNRAYTKVLKSFLANVNTPFSESTVSKSDIERLQAKVGQLEMKPNFYHYYQASLSALNGNGEACVKHLLLQLAVTNDFWVYSKLAQHCDEGSVRMALLEKAWFKSNKDEMGLKILESLVGSYLKESRYDCAKWAIERIVQLREHEGWRVSSSIYSEMEAQWFTTASAKAPKEDPLSDELIFTWASLFVEKKRGIISFAANRKSYLLTKSGDSFKLKTDSYSVGTLVEVLCSDYSKVLPLVHEFKGADADLLKEISGKLYRHVNGFGLVNSCFIPAHLMAKIPDNEQEVRVKAMLSYDKKKNKLSWKAIDIISKGETSELCVGSFSSQNSFQFSPSGTT